MQVSKNNSHDLLGYDGIVPTDTDAEIIAVAPPNQIKFANDNVGTFDARTNVGHLREGYSYENFKRIEEVYVDGRLKKMGELKNYELFSHTNDGPKFVYVKGNKLFRLIDSEVMAMVARAVDAGFGQPKAGIVHVDDKYYRFIVTDYGLRIRTVYEGTKK